MPNRLAGENSPYLLQHANNPVDWYPWGVEALEKARNEDKPIFLSIGYAACHWCHVMAHESFEDPRIAELLNRHFVSIKVDREERPDIDSIYMAAVVAISGHGGWPMSMFLMPDGQPFYGGTYFPPVRRYNMPSFQDVLTSVVRAWEQERTQIVKTSQQLSAHMQQVNAIPSAAASSLDAGSLDRAAMNLGQSYDWKFGGWGSAPKFPQPMTIEYLLRRAARGDTFSRDMAIHALQAMAKGGMYDVVGGGFSRYSTDNFWLVPHFEKMLYDNAQLAQAYLHGYLVAHEPEFRRICEDTLDFILRELTSPDGGFYSSLDADSEGLEGKYYVWSYAEFQQLLSDPDDLALLSAAYNLTQAGNFEGANILQRALSDEQLADRFNLPVEAVPVRLQDLRLRLQHARLSRVRPGTDDKVLVSWNALCLSAFARAARYLNRPDYLQAARRSGAFLLEELYTGERLLRSWRNGRARHNAYLEDYAALVIALLDLYQSDPVERWYQQAEKLLDEMLSSFSDSRGGFFDVRHDQDALISRPKDLQDNATPSGSALAVQALLMMAAYSGRGDLYTRAESMLAAHQDALARYPTAFARWLSCLDYALSATKEVAIIGDPADARTQALLRVVWEKYRPELILAATDVPISPSAPWLAPRLAPRLLENRTAIAGQPAAYVCQNFVCKLPVTDPQALSEQLEP
jgi:hypothetical protein